MFINKVLIDKCYTIKQKICLDTVLKKDNQINSNHSFMNFTKEIQKHKLSLRYQ